MLFDHSNSMSKITKMIMVVVKDTFKIYKFDFEGDKHPRADSETDPCDHY